MKYWFIILFLLPLVCLSQQQPLSRNDSALIKKSLNKYWAELEQNDFKEASRQLNEVAIPLLES